MIELTDLFHFVNQTNHHRRNGYSYSIFGLSLVYIHHCIIPQRSSDEPTASASNLGLCGARLLFANYIIIKLYERDNNTILDNRYDYTIWLAFKKFLSISGTSLSIFAYGSHVRSSHPSHLTCTCCSPFSSTTI